MIQDLLVSIKNAVIKVSLNSFKLIYPKVSQLLSIRITNASNGAIAPFILSIQLFFTLLSAQPSKSQRDKRSEGKSDDISRSNSLSLVSQLNGKYHV